MTSRIAVSGIVVPIVLMALGLIQIFLGVFNVLFSFFHLLVIFIYTCIMSYLAKKKGFVKEFVCSYFVMAIPVVMNFLFVFTLNLQFIENSFFYYSTSFDNLVFCLMVGGFIPSLDTSIIVRSFYDGTSGFDYFDVLFDFAIATILLVTPLVIYKLTKTPKVNAEKNSYGSKID